MSPKRLYFLFFLISILTILNKDYLFSISAKEIIKKSEEAIRGDTSIGIYEITIKTRRWTRSMMMKSFESRHLKKSFVEIYAPLKDAGNRFLLIKNNMWHYVPKLQQTIKISPSMMLQSWMGSDFTNDDIVKESSIIDDYTHKIVGKEIIDKHTCYKLSLSPKTNAAVVWGKIIYYARESDYLLVKEEFYNERNELKKILICTEFKKMHKRIIPTLYKMQTVKKKDRYTIMKIKKIKFNIKISPKVFSLQNLKKK